MTSPVLLRALVLVRGYVPWLRLTKFTEYDLLGLATKTIDLNGIGDVA